MSFTYKDAGVDIDAGERAVALMKAHVRRTFTPAVLADLGSFGAMYQPDLKPYTQPVLVASTDGVGTKVKVATLAGRYTTVGQDLVNHCVNDILVQGARALFFLDYYAVGKLDPMVAAQIVEGLSKACAEAGCALIGGETAEMPAVYAPGDFDLAGTIVGIVERSKVLTGAAIQPSDVVIGLASNGLHTNGYTLARKLVFEVGDYTPDALLTTGRTAADELLRVHRCYANAVLPILANNIVHGMAHITGGGLPGNLVRVLPDGCHALLKPSAWPSQPIFSLLGELGHVPIADMYHTFNMGVGYVLVVSPAAVEDVLQRLQSSGETAWAIGEIYAGPRGVEVQYNA